MEVACLLRKGEVFLQWLRWALSGGPPDNEVFQIAQFTPAKHLLCLVGTMASCRARPSPSSPRQVCVPLCHTRPTATLHEPLPGQSLCLPFQTASPGSGLWSQLATVCTADSPQLRCAAGSLVSGEPCCPRGPRGPPSLSVCSQPV